jgi:short-subunit dehydrogenase
MLTPRHILITGASSGIGAALAILYAAAGVRLSLHGRDADRLAEVAGLARGQGATVQPHIGDVTDTESMAAWVAGCDAAQPIDLVIANAGVSIGTSDGQDMAAHARATFTVNVNGVFNTVHPCLPLMARRRHGQIAIMSSLASFRGFPGAAAYCASKAAVRVYGEALRSDMAPHGVKVNVICPGFIKTPMTDVNSFPMPFIMSAERAAHIIRDGLARDRARIAFPWPMYLGVRLLAALPQSLADLLSRRTPRKPGS